MFTLLPDKNTEILHSFAPVITAESRVLILGTMPGVASLEKQQYYGFPHNAFWRIMAALTGTPAVPERYDERLEMLRSHRIALWDVCRSCRREGSLDSNICEEIPNDIPGLLAAHPSIRTVAFNGGPAFRLFKRHIGLEGMGEGKEVLVLPSTSPANASWSYERKLAAWGELKRRLL